MCELNVFETHRYAENVNLVFDNFVLTSMLAGKKIMKLPNMDAFEYLPGESVIVPPGECMQIDFPEAKRGNPTQCIALTISDELIRNTIGLLNEHHAKHETWGNWELDLSLLHLNNNKELADTVNRMLRITFNQQGKAKDIMVELTIKEMIVRLMQTQARALLESSFAVLSSCNALAASIAYIKKNLSRKIDMNKLADIACMSRASFYKKFREALGETPSQFIQNERIKKACDMLKNSSLSVTSVCYDCGFENLSHFITSFKSQTGKTPRAYQLSVANRGRYSS
jgi:AraC-like DNA-binding protein